MVLVTPKDHLKRLLASLYNEGVLDRKFEQLRGLQDDDHPGFIVDVLTVFCEESDSICREIDQLLERPPLDYHKIIAHVHQLEPPLDYHRIIAHVHQLKGCCSSVGGRRVKIYCEEVQISYEKDDTAGIMRALTRLKQESFRLRIHFQTVIELERQILENKTV